MKTGMPFLYLWIVVSLWLLPDKAVACSCIKRTPCENFGYSSAVFVGRMTEGTEKVSEVTKDSKTTLYEAGHVRFTVEESFKGVTSTEITIFVLNAKGTSCEGTSLARGARYLVYAYSSERIGLSIGPCSPTKLVEEAKEDFEFLRNLPAPGVGGRLQGQVAVETGSREPTPLAGVTLIIEDENQQRIETKTNESGSFELTGLKPGKYTINPVLPENYIFRDQYQQSREVIITDRGCAKAPFWLNVAGRISGRVTDSRGRPAPADLELVSVDQEKRQLYGYTDEDGQYEIYGVPPGRYLLYVELMKGEKEEPYFHPGQMDKSQATVIKIGMGQKLEGYDLQLPPSLQVITVSGVVKYSDGRPASNVEVRLIGERGVKAEAYRANDLYTEALTDGSGRFQLSGYKDVIYRILVIDDLRTAIEEKRRAGRAEVKNLILKEDKEGVLVVLPLESNSGEKQSLARNNAPNN